jgi:hypothetical protein
MEEFKKGGRLSPLKVKEFIPAGTLGIGVDENVWIRKARTDGKTYWAEFLETWNYSKIIPDYYDLNNEIRFESRPKVEEKYGYQIIYNYSKGFKLIIFDADTLLDIEVFTTENPQKFREICINVRDSKTFEITDASLRYEFTEIVGKLTLAFDKGELRRDFTEAPTDTPPVPETPETEIPKSKFEIGDYVKVVNDLQQIMRAYDKQKEYEFYEPNDTKDVQNGTEGYVTAVYYEPEFKENRIVVKKYDNNGFILHEFIIAEKGLELVSKALKLGDTVYVKDTTYLYPTSPDGKRRLGFSDPNSISRASEVSYTTGKIFVVGQDRDLMPIYGVNISWYDSDEPQQILIGAQGLELVKESKGQSLGAVKIKVNNAEENKILQEYLFRLGYYWLGSKRDVVEEFNEYPVYIETQDFDSPSAIFSMTKKQFDRSEKMEVSVEFIVGKKTVSTCNVDVSKINSPAVGSFYANNKERIEKLNSEFSCKILEALVYLSDYENCGGGIELPAKKVEEVDDLLGEIRNL